MKFWVRSDLERLTAVATWQSKQQPAIRYSVPGRVDFLGNCHVISRRSGRDRPRVSMSFDRLLMVAIAIWEANAPGIKQVKKGP
jgi:hypothetical protein